MVFSSLVFLWLFLPITLLLYYFAKLVHLEKGKNIILLFVSLFFYAWGEPIYIILMLISIVVNYCMGLWLGVVKDTHRKWTLLGTICFNIGILFYFKYFTWILSLLPFGEVLHCSISLPIGISFFTFQALSYVIDVYRKEVKSEKNILNLALYISFFPQLIAGPIVKYSDISEQIKRRKETSDKFQQGVRRFVYGLGKKVIIANTLAEVVDSIAQMNIFNVNFAMAWILALFYTFQIYYDFSGYSDILIWL